MDGQNNSNSVPSPGGGGGYASNNTDNNGNVNYYQQRHASEVTQPSSGFRSVYLNTDYDQQQHFENLDLDNIFSRMSLYNGGSVFNNNGNVGGDELYYNRRGAEQSTSHANNTTSFYGSASNYMQNVYGSSSSSNSLIDHYNGFNSMNNLFQSPLPPLPSDPYHRFLENSALVFPPRNNQLQFPNGTAFDNILSTTDSLFDSQHFPQLGISYLNGGNQFSNNGMTSMGRIDHQSHRNDQHQYSSNNISFNNMKGNLVNYAMDQHGCRILHNMFDQMEREQFDFCFQELIRYITQIMMDQYGNFIFQKLVELCTIDQRTQIVVSITRYPSALIDMCLNTYGYNITFLNSMKMYHNVVSVLL